MPSELHKKAIARITPEERQEMIAKLRALSFGRWLNAHGYTPAVDQKDTWMKWEHYVRRYYTTEELYEKYDNDIHPC